MIEVIKGEKIILKKISLQDVTEEYLSWLKDEEVMEGIETSNYTYEKLYSYIENVLKDKNTEMFTIRDKNSNKHVGNIKIVNDFFNRHSEMGILIGDKNYWRKGVGTEACKLIINYVFEFHKMNKIWLAVHSSNISAYHLYKKLGFKEEGCLKEHVFKNGKFIDKYLMALFQREWKVQH